MISVKTQYYFRHGTYVEERIDAYLGENSMKGAAMILTKQYVV